jgi:hypothetical protein
MIVLPVQSIHARVLKLCHTPQFDTIWDVLMTATRRGMALLLEVTPIVEVAVKQNKQFGLYSHCNVSVCR